MDSSGTRNLRRGVAGTVRRIVLGGTGLLAGLAGTLVFRALRYGPLEERPAARAAPGMILDGDLERLAAAIRIPTISSQDPLVSESAGFEVFRAYLEQAFPRVHASIEHEVISGWSLLYTWRGTDPTLSPVVLMGHFDVVPADPATLGLWTHAPFSGAIEDGAVWGRGTLDDKATVIALLEAIETMLSESEQPRRTVYLALTHDEEIGGEAGAVGIARILARRGVEPLFVLDEGGVIADGVVEGVDRRIALLGIAEKGYAEVELTVEAEGGHASMPRPQTPAGIIGAAVASLEANPMPARLEDNARRFFDRVGREMSFGRRIVMANLWLLGPLLTRQLEKEPSTNAVVRTTTAVTMLEGSPKGNMLPTFARAVVNFRILPGDDVAGVVEHVRRTVNDDRVSIRLLGFAGDPSPAAPVGGKAWTTLTDAIRRLDPDVLVAPFLFVGTTSSRHFTVLTDRIYRFMPIRFTPDDLLLLHGTNERIRVEDYRKLVAFYVDLMRQAVANEPP